MSGVMSDSRPPSAKVEIRRFLANGGVVIVLLIGAIVVTAIAEPRFLNRLNIINVLRNFAFLALPAIGQMVVMTVGGFDLSVGGAMAVASVLTASLMPLMGGFGIPFSIGAGVASGVGLGFLNGALVVRYAISPFMVTLANLSIITGAALYCTQGIPVYGVSDRFISVIGRGEVLGLPAVTVIAIGFIAGAIVVQRFTAFGRHLYAVGSHLPAARLSGIRTGRVLLIAYAVSGGLAALTGILLTARIGSGQSTIGGTLGLETIAAAVIGGVSLRGGSGRAEHVALAALFLSIVSNAMNLLRVESKFQTLVLGFILILALSIERIVQGRRSVA